MSTSLSSSNIRVFITFKEATVFAGEEVEATITFKNVPVPRPAQTNARSRTGITAPAPPLSVASHLPSGPTHSRRLSLTSQATQAVPASSHNPASGHRQTLSLNLHNANAGQTGTLGAAGDRRRRGNHGRSVSIVSLGSDTGVTKKGGQPSARDPTRPGFKLSRSASLQVSPTSTGSPRLNGSASMPTRLPSTRYGVSDDLSTGPSLSANHRSPLSPHENLPWGNSVTVSPPNAHEHTHSSLGGTTPRLAHTRSSSARVPQTSKLPPSSFRFPTSAQNGSLEQASHPLQSTQKTEPVIPCRPAVSPTRKQLPQLLESRVASPDLKPPPLNRVMSLASDHGTARSSMELYSTSNRSDETVVSEYISSPATRLLGRQTPSRTPSRSAHARKQPAETLMMGFAQLHGCFTLDGSLVNQAPFEEVKRRAVVGGQGGGGVVGIERGKAETGIFGSLGWSSIGESLGGLLGGSEPSSIREMKGIAHSQSIPLLSTPKSILFVDLKLEPGESKSYTYTFTLPRGLPPSHRGRAMKVAYQIVIGTQRPGSAKSSSREQQIRQVEVPFRVFGGVDGHGETLGHDLMSPYIVLKDQAQTTAVQADGSGKAIKQSPGPVQHPQSNEADFNSYITDLLTNASRGSVTDLLSPTRSTPNTPHGNALHPTSSQSSAPTARALIDNAIRMSTQPLHQQTGRKSPQPTTSQTSFTIARAGKPIAQLALSRPALRLGDILPLALDFPPQKPSPDTQNSPSPVVHAITLTLESSETVDAALAVRSPASVERATRRVWDRWIIGSANAAALGWCKRWAGSFKVPSHATPGFATTGVSVNWAVRVELAVAAIVNYEPRQEHEDREATGGRAGQEAEAGDPGEEDDRVADEANSENDRMIPPASSTSASRQLPPSKRAPDPASTPPGLGLRAGQLLEPVSSDGRGITYVARQHIPVETFEIVVPIRVFGAVGAIGPDGIGAASAGGSGTEVENSGQGFSI